MNNTKHSNDCKRVFKNYDRNCARCLELINGSQARDGWQKQYFTMKAKEQQYSERLNIAYYNHSKLNHDGFNPGGYCLNCSFGRDHS